MIVAPARGIQGRCEKETPERLRDGDYADAKRAPERLHRKLMDVNPSAARSLEETLTVHKLRILETICWNLNRWQPGDQMERWVGSGLLVAKRQLRKVRRRGGRRVETC